MHTTADTALRLLAASVAAGPGVVISTIRKPVLLQYSSLCAAPAGPMPTSQSVSSASSPPASTFKPVSRA